MKVKRLVIKNIGLIADANISLDQPLILFYGDIQAGKTTYLNAVRWCFGGSFPADIIRHGETIASVSLEFDNGSITRDFYVSKVDKTTKARAISFIQDGKPVPQPVAAIEKLLNPYLLDQNFLLNKTERERRQYFANLFAVDTATDDAAIAKARADAEKVRAKISGYGVIDATPVPEVNTAALKARIDSIRQAHTAEVEAISAHNTKISDTNRGIHECETEVENRRIEIERLEHLLSGLRPRFEEKKLWLNHNSRKPLNDLPVAPDVSGLEAELAAGIANNVRAEQAAKNLERLKEKNTDEGVLRSLEETQRTLKESKIARLAALSSTCGIPGLSFNEEGDFSYQGSEAGMLSTSQIMELSSLLSAKYPQGFGLDLIDRGESLGSSIFRFVERAQAENKTIIATIVGERPAVVPEHVGVFVVEQGKAS